MGDGQAPTTRPLPAQSFVVETNYGGMPVTICGCGVLLLRNMDAWNHIDQCPTMQGFYAEQANHG